MMNLKYKDFVRRAAVTVWYYSAYEDDPCRMNHNVWLRRMGLFESWFLKYNNISYDSPRSLRE